jgi:hypothetical protein
MAAPGGLFGLDAPSGFLYRPDFITSAEEAALVAEISHVAFADFEMRGVVARRRVAFFGASYGRGGANAPFPSFLVRVRAAVAEWAGLEPLLSPCRMKFRPCQTRHTDRSAPRRHTTHDVVLEARSAYLMTGEARSGYEHHIPAVPALRYSMTFRTLRGELGKEARQPEPI